MFVMDDKAESCEDPIDAVVRRIDTGLARLKGLSRELTKLPRSGDDFRQTVARLAQLAPEPGYDLLNNAAIGVHLVGPDGTILWANECELKTLGYAPLSYFGKSITEFHMDADVIRHILTSLSCGENLDAYPARLKAADGSVI
jgi:hypothetical protein